MDSNESPCSKTDQGGPSQLDAAPLAGSFLQAHPSLGPLLIVLIGIVFLNPLWTRHEIVYSSHSDLICQFLSLKAIGQRAIAEEGRFPLWNPSMSGGAPAFANPESMYLFPLDWLYLACPIEVATNLVILLNVLLAGLGMYWFSHRFLKHPFSALFCALAYMLSHRYLAMVYTGWLPKMSMYALTPFLFWASESLVKEPTTRRTAFFSIVTALTFLQGDMQQLYHSGLGSMIYAGVRIATIPQPARVRALLSLAVGGVLGILLAAPAIFPRLEFVSLSTRMENDYDFFLYNPPTPTSLTTFFDPHNADETGAVRHEFWENNFYFGLWLVPLWLFAFHRNARRALPLLVSGLVMVFVCFDSFVLRWLYHYLPGFDLFRQSPRILLLAQFVLVLLAGLGLNDLWARQGERSAMRLFSLCVFLSVVVGLIAPIPWNTSGPHFILGSLVIIGIASLLPWERRAAVLTLLLLFPILDSSLRMLPMISTRPLEQAVPRHALHDSLNRAHGEGRVLAIGRTAIPYGMAGFYSIDVINGYAPLELRHYVEYFTVLQYGNSSAIPHHPRIWIDCTQIAKPDMLRALDVRSIVGNPPLQLDPIGAKKIKDYPQVPIFVFYAGIQSLPVEVWSLDQPLGPAYFASSVQGVKNESQSLARLESATSVLDACVMGLDRDVRDFSLAGGSATMVHRGINRYEYRVESQGSNFLILSQIWYPGWTATLDGQKTKLYRTNHALLGCFIPSGTHQLVLQMTCRPLRYGLFVSVAAMVFLIVLFRVRAAPPKSV